MLKDDHSERNETHKRLLLILLIIFIWKYRAPAVAVAMHIFNIQEYLQI